MYIGTEGLLPQAALSVDDKFSYGTPERSCRGVGLYDVLTQPEENTRILLRWILTPQHESTNRAHTNTVGGVYKCIHDYRVTNTKAMREYS